MRHMLRWIGVMALSVNLVPILAADDNADPTTKPDAKDTKQLDKIVKSGKAFDGRLVKIDQDQRWLTVEVTYKTAKQDPQIARNLYNLQLQLAEAQRNKNPAERLQRISHI